MKQKRAQLKASSFLIAAINRDKSNLGIKLRRCLLEKDHAGGTVVVPTPLLSRL